MTSPTSEYSGGEVHHRTTGTANNAEGTSNGENHVLDTVLGVEQDPPGDTGGSEPQKKSGIFGASSNLVNSIVGAGIIGMPYAMKQSGLIAGSLLLLLVGWMTDKSLRIIVDLATFHPQLRRLHVHTYEDLASFPFGRLGSGFILANMFVLAYGAMVAYLLIIKDTVPTLLGIGNTWERELIMVVTSLVIVVPLSMQRDMASLSFTSLLSVLADVVLVIFIAVYAPIKETVSAAGGFGTVLAEDWINPTIFIGLGILSTAMACQHSAFIVSGSLANKTRARWAAVTYRSLFIATTLSGILGICGYLGFLGTSWI
jgi:sodium-coupled neutral amino acid transporter 11